MVYEPKKLGNCCSSSSIKKWHLQLWNSQIKWVTVNRLRIRCSRNSWAIIQYQSKTVNYSTTICTYCSPTQAQEHIERDWAYPSVLSTFLFSTFSSPAVIFPRRCKWLLHCKRLLCAIRDSMVQLSSVPRADAWRPGSTGSYCAYRGGAISCCCSNNGCFCTACPPLPTASPTKVAPGTVALVVSPQLCYWYGVTKSAF